LHYVVLVLDHAHVGLLDFDLQDTVVDFLDHVLRAHEVLGVQVRPLDIDHDVLRLVQVHQFLYYFRLVTDLRRAVFLQLDFLEEKIHELLILCRLIQLIPYRLR
jgi:hypothetical protein